MNTSLLRTERAAPRPTEHGIAIEFNTREDDQYKKIVSEYILKFLQFLYDEGVSFDDLVGKIQQMSASLITAGQAYTKRGGGPNPRYSDVKSQQYSSKMHRSVIVLSMHGDNSKSKWIDFTLQFSVRGGSNCLPISPEEMEIIKAAMNEMDSRVSAPSLKVVQQNVSDKIGDAVSWKSQSTPVTWGSSRKNRTPKHPPVVDTVSPKNTPPISSAPIGLEWQGMSIAELLEEGKRIIDTVEDGLSTEHTDVVAQIQSLEAEIRKMEQELEGLNVPENIGVSITELGSQINELTKSVKAAFKAQRLMELSTLKWEIEKSIDWYKSAIAIHQNYMASIDQLTSNAPELWVAGSQKELFAREMDGIEYMAGTLSALMKRLEGFLAQIELIEELTAERDRLKELIHQKKEREKEMSHQRKSLQRLQARQEALQTAMNYE